MTEPKTTLPILCLWILHLGLISQAILGRFGYQSVKMHVGQLLCVFKLAARIKSSEIHNFSRKQKHTDIYIYIRIDAVPSKRFTVKHIPMFCLLKVLIFNRGYRSNIQQSLFFTATSTSPSDFWMPRTMRLDVLTSFYLKQKWSKREIYQSTVCWWLRLDVFSLSLEYERTCHLGGLGLEWLVNHQP